MPKPVVISKNRLEASICKESFYQFFLRFWETLCPEKLVENWHIKFICDEMQKVAERVFARLPKEYDLIINVSPGSTKSSIVSEMFPAWCWARDPTLRFICGSYAYTLSHDLAKRTRRIVTSDKYKKLFPEVELVTEGVDIIETGRGGQRIAASVGGGITGLHAHFLITDDPVNPQEALSELMLKQANEWFDQTLSSRVVDKSIVPNILIMQRLHQGDPTAHMLGKGAKVRYISLPADCDAGTVFPEELRARYVEGLFDPIRLPRNVLRQAEADMGQYAYAGQYLQSPTPAGGGMFKIANIEIIDGLDLEKRPAKLVRSWDKSATGGGGAYTVGLLLARTVDKTFYIMDVVRGQWEAAQRERVIRQTAEADGKGVVIVIEQEPGSGGKESAQSTVRNLAGYSVRIDKPSGSGSGKINRADPVAVQVNSGNFKMVKRPWNKALLEELSFFPYSKYKDQTDALSAAFNCLVKPMHVGGMLLRPRGQDDAPVGDDAERIVDEGSLIRTRMDLAKAAANGLVNMRPGVWGGPR